MRALLVLGLLACGGGSDPDAVEDAVAVAPEQPVLSDDAYRFCHEPGLDADEALEYCDLLDGLAPEVCPGLRETCAGAAPVSSAGCGEGGGGGGGADGVAGSPDKPKKPWRPEACELPDAPADSALGIMRWVGAILVALLVLAVLRAVWTYFGSRSVPVVDDVLLPAVEEEPVLEDVPDLPSTDLLAAARAALEAGDHGQAVLLARGAALRRLGDVGRLRLHRSKTDREYARAVRRDAEVHGPLREVLVAVEIHRWGGALLDAARSRAAVEAAARVLQAAGAACILALSVSADVAQAQSGRYGPNGDAALPEVLEAWGHDAGFRLRGLDSLDESIDVLVLDAAWVVPDDEGWGTLRTWVEAGGVLLVGGDCPWEELGERVSLAGPVPVEGAEVLADLGLPAPRLAGGPEWAWEGGQGQVWVRVWRPRGPVWLGALSEQDGAARLVDFDDQLAVVTVTPIGAGQVVAVADSRLLWNGSFVDPGNERFFGDLLHAGGGVLAWGYTSPARVELATTAASSSPTPSQSMLNADLLPFVIQLLLLWTLVALWKGWPFAPLEDPPEEGRLAFAEHVRALGTRWFRRGASRYALAAYGGLWLQRLGPAGLRQAAIRAGRDKHRAQALVDALQAAIEDPKGPDSEHDLEWMEELWTITHHR